MAIDPQVQSAQDTLNAAARTALTTFKAALDAAAQAATDAAATLPTGPGPASAAINWLNAIGGTLQNAQNEYTNNIITQYPEPT